MHRMLGAQAPPKSTQIRLQHTTQVSPWAAFIWRPDIYKYSAFNMLPASAKDIDSGSTMTLIPRVPRIVYSMVEVRLDLELIYSVGCNRVLTAAARWR